MPAKHDFRPTPFPLNHDGLTAPGGSLTAAKVCRAPRRTRLIAVTVAMTLPLLRVGRVFGEENEVGYRKSYYEENDNRISVSTDVWSFNVGLKDNIRVSGEIVVDAITGATPTGAAAPASWNYKTYNDYFQAAYQPAYAQALANLSAFYNTQQITYQQWTNAAATTARGPATAAATQAYAALTNNPSYHSNKVPLTPMHDHRNAFSLELPMTFGRHQITPSFAYSCESDYISIGGALNYSLSLNDKNTTLSAGWAHNGDTVWDHLNTGNWYSKMTDNVFVGLVQLFGPKAYLTVDASLSFEHGFLADPYRSVMAANLLQDSPDGGGEGLIYEQRPKHRDSQIFYTSWTQFVTPLNGSFELSYRFFHDSYGIFAHTAELDWHQKIGKTLVISPKFRYYVQNAADFYYIMVPDANNLPSFFTSDYRLSEMESLSTGVTITWRFQKHWSLDASYMRYVMQGLDGATSQSAYPSADVYSAGLRMWF